MKLHNLCIDIFRMVQLFHTIHYVILEITKQTIIMFKNNANYSYK